MQTQTSNTLHNAIMEASSKDRPPMLALGNYVQWKSIIKRYIDTKPNHELIHYCLTNPPYELGWIEKEIPISEGSPITRFERFQETYKNVSQEIRDQLNAEAEAKAIERLKQGESINVQDLKTNLYWEFGKYTSQDGELLESYYSRFYKMMNELIRNQCKNQELKTVSYHKLYDILKQHQHEVNEIKAEKIARVANPLALVAQQQPDKEIDKLMALISLSFKKIYKPANNNLRTSSNTSRANQDNSPRINRSAGHVARECHKPNRAKDAAYHREKMMLYQELEAHYMYMAQLQQVSPDAADSGPIFDDEPLQKISNDDHYNVFAMQSEHPEQSESVHDTYPIDQDAHNVIIDSLDMSYDKKEIDQNDDDNDLATYCNPTFLTFYIST
uniref:Gag-Pol polyprotein n=1 Tax=Tanacetum cinerariifolium TaxID=118510 RepID=A0A6L2MAT0_TANCI|nr:hypothetical protein [Tanacetum cinerariifolium]